MSDSTVNGIPRVDPRAGRAAWKRGPARLTSTKPGAAVHRTIAAPLDAAVMKITGGRANLAAGAMPLVVLALTGARSGQRREVPLGYFTDGDDVILIASNYGVCGTPGGTDNLLTQPQCELHIGPRGGQFVARETEGADHDRLFELAVDFYPGYARSTPNASMAFGRSGYCDSRRADGPAEDVAQRPDFAVRPAAVVKWVTIAPHWQPYHRCGVKPGMRQTSTIRSFLFAAAGALVAAVVFGAPAQAAATDTRFDLCAALRNGTSLAAIETTL